MHPLNRVLVTGGAGFIGAEVVRQLLDRGAERVVTLDALTYAGSAARLPDDDPRHTLVVGDVRATGLVVDLLRRERLTTILHLAAESHVDRSIAGPDLFVETNVLGTTSMLEAARTAWSGEGRFVHVSTDEVYGDLDPGAPPVTEDAPYRPSSPYSASKAAADHLVRAWFRTYGLPVVITHGSNTYGAHQYPEKLIPVVLAAARAGRPIPVYGDGRQVRDWLHVSDHAAGILAAASLGTAGRSYNLGGTSAVNIDVIRQICALVDEVSPEGAPHARWITTVTDRPGHDRRYAIDGGRAALELGWRPAVGFGDGLRRMIGAVAG